MVRYIRSKNFHVRKSFAEKMNYYQNIFVRQRSIISSPILIYNKVNLLPWLSEKERDFADTFYDNTLSQVLS